MLLIAEYIDVHQRNNIFSFFDCYVNTLYNYYCIFIISYCSRVLKRYDNNINKNNTKYGIDRLVETETERCTGFK